MPRTAPATGDICHCASRVQNKSAVSVIAAASPRRLAIIEALNPNVRMKNPRRPRPPGVRAFTHHDARSSVTLRNDVAMDTPGGRPGILVGYRVHVGRLRTARGEKDRAGGVF